MLDTIRVMPAAQEKHVQFIPADMPAVILGDRDKLKQVFINLIGNACEAVEKNDVVTWRIYSSKPEVKIQIHNGGEPIPVDQIDQITQPFFTTKSSGNGLGLAIVKRIVEAHGGELAIASEKLTGTVVEVKIPTVPT
jgi:signal transduction histidine kinase